MERRRQNVVYNSVGTAFVIGMFLCIMGISSKINATTLTTPAIQVGTLNHSYSYSYIWDPEHPETSQCFTYIGDGWTLQQDGPSFTPDLSSFDYYFTGSYYDAVSVSFTAGQGKKFVVNPPVIGAAIHVGALFSLFPDSQGQPVFPDSVSATFEGPSGETVMTGSIPTGMFYVGEDYEGYYGDTISVIATLPIPEHLEFSSIKLICHYNVWPEEIILDDGIGDPYTLRAGATGISFGGTYEDWVPLEDYGQIASIVPIPEPLTVLLLGLGGLVLRRNRK